jgi:hypothetical protein
MNMIAALPAAAADSLSAAAPVGDVPLGEVIAAWSVAPGALVLLGWQQGAPPAEGVAQLERRRADRGPFRSASWPRGGQDDPLTSFIIAVRLPQGADVRPGQRLALIPADGPPVLAVLPGQFIDGERFAAEAARLAGPHASLLARFLCDTFPSAALARLPDMARMMSAYLDRVSLADGCVEILGAVPGGCAFLQGWGPLPEGGVQVILVGARVACVLAHAAAFDRPDISAPSTGVVLVLPPQAAALLPGLARVHVLSATGVSRRDVVTREMLGAEASHGHLRDLLPALRCGPGAAELLKAALRPRFGGADTVSAAPQPVRAAVDIAVLAPGAGVYLVGWLFDPARVATCVFLRGSNGFSARVDGQWVRIPREDVSGVFAGDPGFPTAARHDHGFAAFVPGSPADGAGLHLEVGFADGGCAFLPVACAPPEGAAAAALGNVDMHKRGAHAVIEHALAPLFLALSSRPAAPAVISRHGAAEAAHAVVVPLAGAPLQPKAFLSQFLHDPPGSDEALVLVCGDRWDDLSVAALRRCAAFYGLPASVLRTEGPASGTGALDAAAAATGAHTFLLASPGAVGITAGWRRALRDAAEAGPVPRCACPTILYEDMSVRYSGISGMEATDCAPWISVRSEFAGFPSALVPGGDAAEPALIGSLSCCLVPRAALERAGGARRATATEWGAGTAFFLRLREAGVATVWVPGVRVVVPEAGGGESGAAAAGRMVDGWCLRATAAGMVRKG